MTINAGFRQSSFCSSGNCVQVAHLDGGQVAIRDSKNLGPLAQHFPEPGWTRFREMVKSGALAAGPPA